MREKDGWSYLRRVGAVLGLCLAATGTVIPSGGG